MSCLLQEPRRSWLIWQVWFCQPNTTSCPMCRRDIAVLACVDKMLPEAMKSEGLGLWMATGAAPAR